MRKTSSTLIAIVLVLLAVGIVMLASTSSVKGQASFGDAQYFLKRQLLWLLFSLGLGVALARFDYHGWQRLSFPLLGVAVLLLVLVLVPGVGTQVKGSHRWLRLGPLSVQPSEPAKFVTVMALAAWMAHVGRRIRRLKEGLLVPMLILGVVLGLIILEPDFGTTLLTGMVGMIMMYAAGTRLSYLVVVGTLGVCGFVLAVSRDPVRMGRIMAFLMPEKYPAIHYHLAQSKIAFIHGGALGVGLGKSMQKQFYLPEAHTDFIFAIMGEELGFVATSLTVLMFLGILICGIVISLRASDAFGKLLAFGLTLLIALQAAINMGVVTGCLPTKGIALPFISYGGSSLMVSVACVGVLVNIAHHVERGGADDHTRLIKDSAHRF